MSKMDRQLNSKKDKETIYEIYRACRLCGAGAGYKMPIIQNVVDLDDTDVELRQKVRDCVQIEVHQDDKMPPLICELCVDKVNDFYEFLEMCRQTNKRTRLRLGLPPQSMPRGAPDAGECILGLTEPVYVNEDSDGEPLSKQKKINPKVKVKREPELKVRLENKVLTEIRPSRFTKREPTPPRVTRHRTNSKEENVSLSRLKDTKSQKPSPKPILKKETKNEDNSLLTSRLKRTRDKEPIKLETPVKRVKITTRTSSSSSPQTPKSSPKISPRTVTKSSKSPKLSPARPPSPPRLFKCSVCGQSNKTSQANSNHMRSHTVGFTSPKLACNPCGLWFPTADEAAAHHKQHRNKSKPYNCTRCDADFRHLTGYDDHLENNECIPFDEVPDVKCEECWHLFATNKLLEDHKCLGEDHRPGGKCSKCRRSYTLLKNLKKHELTCTAKKKGEFIVDPELLGKLKPIQIRMSRCDPLLTNLKQEHYDVSNVTADFGLDKNCVYPYISSVSSLRIKSDPDGMVDIQDEIKNEFYTEEDYVHWDSEDSETDEESSVKKKIDTLANLTLKTLFSKKCLGKVPKRKRRVKHEKNLFDSLLAGTDDDISRDINNIIDNLGGDDDEFDGKGADKELNDSDKIMDVSDDKVTDENDSFDKSGVNDKNDICDDEVTKDEEKDLNVSKNDNSACNDDIEGSNNNLSSNNDNISLTDKVNNGTINLNSLSFDYDDGVVISKKNYDASSPLSKDENDGSETKTDENTKIDFENSQDSNSIGGASDSLLNTQNDNENIDKISIDNATSLSENNDVDENKSQSVEDSKPSEFEDDKSQNSEKETENSQNSDNKIENDHKNAISVIVKTKASTESEDLEDSKLMAALDAQIGEGNENSRDVTNENSREFSENSQEQINENIREQINENSRDRTNENSRDQTNENSRDQTNENSRDQTNENSRDQTNGNSRDQTNENSRNQTNENSREQTNEISQEQINENFRENENSREQTNENSRDEINENSREKIIDNFNNDKIALEDLITAKNSDLDMIPEEFNFDD